GEEAVDQFLSPEAGDSADHHHPEESEDRPGQPAIGPPPAVQEGEQEGQEGGGQVPAQPGRLPDEGKAKYAKYADGTAVAEEPSANIEAGKQQDGSGRVAAPARKAPVQRPGPVEGIQPGAGPGREQQQEP